MSNRFLSICITLFFTPLVWANAITVNVGIYQNPPKIFMDDSKKPSGFFVDIINHIARENQWNIHYVPCEWHECLAKLEKGDIDLMPDVAYSKEREQRFDFNQEVILSSWSMVYTNKGSQIDSVLDLQGKKIAVVKNSIQYDALNEQARLLDVHLTLVEVETFDEAFRLLTQRHAEAAVVNNFYGTLYASQNNVVSTRILFNPVMLKFAFPKNLTLPIKEPIDASMRRAKNDASSFFFSAKKQWLETLPEEPSLPQWLTWAFALILVTIAALVSLVAFFRYLLNAKIKELKENQKMLVAQSRHAAMGEMMSMIAHQWKQPLTVLSMIANNIRMDLELGTLDTKHALTYYEKLTQQINYLSRTIDDFSNFFKPQKGKQFLRDLSELIDNALNLMRPSLEKHHITIVPLYEPIYNVRLHANELMHIILNLLKNAQDAFEQNPRTGATIYITTHVEDNTVFIDIEDNAGGIDPSVQHRIFDPYFTTKEKLNGTGLGLYMSKSIIESYFHGKISFTCKAGKTKFTLQFPLKEIHEQAT